VHEASQSPAQALLAKNFVSGQVRQVVAVVTHVAHVASHGAQVDPLKKFPSEQAEHSVAAGPVQALHFESQALHVLSVASPY
jgi:hypothetical protein